MIGHLKGRLVHKHPPTLVIDVGGVGYEVEAPMSTFYTLPQIGSELRLLTHLLVRDDAHVLYGFGTERERRLFRHLLKVSGVGARMALAILSGIDADIFVQCIRDGDTASLVGIPGVGKKTAERLIVEMRDRIDEGVFAAGPVPAAAAAGESAEREAFSALVALGYKSTEVNRMLTGVETAGQTTEEIIRRVLQSAAAT